MTVKKNKYTAFLLLLVFLFTSLVPLSAVEASESEEAQVPEGLKIEVIQEDEDAEENVLRIGFAAEESNEATKAYIKAIQEVNINGVIYFPEDLGAPGFKKTEDAVILKDNPASAKENNVQIKAEGYEIYNNTFNNEAGYQIADGLSIVSISAGRQGGELGIGVEDYKRTVEIMLKDKYGSSNDGNLYRATQKITDIMIDGKHYDRMGSDGRSQWMLVNSNVFCTYQGVPSDNKCFEDFIAAGGNDKPHKVVLTFEDGSQISLEEEGYVEREEEGESHHQDSGENQEKKPFSEIYGVKACTLEESQYSAGTYRVILSFNHRVMGNEKLTNALNKAIFTINGKSFTFDDGNFRTGYLFEGIASEDQKVIAQFKQKEPVSCKVTWEDGSVSTLGDALPSGEVSEPSAEPTEDKKNEEASLAKVYQILSFEVKNNYGSVMAHLHFNQATNDEEKGPALVKALKEAEFEVNGERFTFAEMNRENQVEFKSYDEGMRCLNPDFIQACKKNTPAVLKIFWKDGSQSTFGEQPTKEEAFTKDAHLEDGIYHIKVSAYNKGTNFVDKSMMDRFIDPIAEVEVKGGETFVRILVKSAASMISDLAFQENGQFVSAKRENRKNKGGGPSQQAEFIFKVKDFTQAVEGAALIPMSGGKESDRGKFERYKHFDLAFESFVERYFPGYESDIKESQGREDSDVVLKERLIKAGVDTNGDNRISVEELEKAKGVNGVLDLSCNDGKKIYNIDLLKDIGPNIREIYLGSNALEALPKEGFPKATNLTFLEVSDNHIQHLNLDVLKANTDLETLNVDRNPLAPFAAEDLKGFSRLQRFSASDCGLKGLPSAFFAKNKELREVNLADNKINHLEDEVFSKNRYLQEVNLANNRLETLPESLFSRSNLGNLNVSHNGLETISEELKNLRKLTELDLSHNALKTLPNEIYDNFAEKVVTYAPTRHRINLNLAHNQLTEVPFIKMAEKIKKGNVTHSMFLNVRYNYLEANPSPEVKKALEIIKCDMERGQYQPQLSAVKGNLQAQGGTIQLHQDLNLGEMLYFEKGDGFNAGKSFFASKDEFLSHLNGGARHLYAIPEGTDRKTAITMILEALGLQNWQIHTELVKTTAAGKTERLVVKDSSAKGIDETDETFTDANMKAGDRYTLSKTMTVKYSTEYSGQNVFTYTVQAEAESDSVISQPKNELAEGTYYVPLTLLKEREDKPSMATAAFPAEAKVVVKDGEYQISFAVQAMNFKGLKGHLTNLFVYDSLAEMAKEEGKRTALEPTGTYIDQKPYPGAFTLKRSQKEDCLGLALWIDALDGDQPGSFEQKARLQLNWSEASDTPLDIKTPTGMLMKEDYSLGIRYDEGAYERVPKSLEVHSFDPRAKAKEDENLAFLGKKGKVKGYQVRVLNDLGEAMLPEKEVDLTLKNPEKEGKKPEVYLKTASGTYKKADVATQYMGPKLGEMLLLKYHGESEIILHYDLEHQVEEPKVTQKEAKAYLLTPDKTGLSHGDRALVREMKWETKGQFRHFEVSFKPLEMKQMTAKISELHLFGHGQEILAEAEAEKPGTFTFKIPEKIAANLPGLEVGLKIVETSGKEMPGHKDLVKAFLLFDWEGTFDSKTLEKNTEKPNQPGHSGGGSSSSSSSSSSSEKQTLPAWIKKVGSEAKSMANAAFEHQVMVTEENGHYQCEIGFKPVTIGGLTGVISNLQVNGKTLSAKETRGEFTYYAFSLDTKQDQVPISFSIEGAPMEGALEAQLMIDWSGHASEPSGETQLPKISGNSSSGGGGGSSTVESSPVEPSKDLASAMNKTKKILKEKKGYTKESLAALEKALEAAEKANKKEDKKKREEALKNLNKALADLKVIKTDKAMTKAVSLTKKAYISGYPDQKFRPNQGMTRAELVSMLAQLATQTGSEKKTFRDVQPDAWYAQAVSKMAGLGVISGYEDGTFAPEKTVTRAEYAAMIARIKALHGDSKKTFGDISATHWGAQAIAACATAGYLQGYPDKTFKPDKVLTRAECVAITNRLVDLKAAGQMPQEKFKDVSKTFWAYEDIMAACK